MRISIRTSWRKIEALRRYWEVYIQKQILMTLSVNWKKVRHQVRQINDIVKHDTKQSLPLPLFFIELEPDENNKDIYKINKLLNTIITFEPLKTKRNIPQCIRCQAWGHTKNYCFRNPACVKCTGTHLTSNCPTSGKIDEIKCYNCKGNHPASYKGCIMRKQLQ